jgi:transcription antitermination factor NusG
MELTARDSCRWFALRVKSNRERVTSLALLGKGFEVFLPVYRKKGSGRDCPLFPGYLFSRFDVQKRLPVLTVPGIVHIVGFGNQPIPVDDDELESVRILVKSSVELSPNVAFAVGESVQVISGPLTGARGCVDGVSPQRLSVAITLLQRSVSVELRPEWITVADPMIARGAQTALPAAV